MYTSPQLQLLVKYRQSNQCFHYDHFGRAWQDCKAGNFPQCSASPRSAPTHMFSWRDATGASGATNATCHLALHPLLQTTAKEMALLFSVKLIWLAFAPRSEDTRNFTKNISWENVKKASTASRTSWRLTKDEICYLWCSKSYILPHVSSCEKMHSNLSSEYGSRDSIWQCEPTPCLSFEARSSQMCT